MRVSSFCGSYSGHKSPFSPTIVQVTAVTDNIVTVQSNQLASIETQVFVYGKQVDDFRSVDYDAISMLNVSATQELAKRNAELELEVSKLGKINDQTQPQLSSLHQENDALKAQFDQLMSRVAGLEAASINN